MSFPAGPTPASLFDHRGAPTNNSNNSSESAPPSTDSTDSTEKTLVANPYRHILTHQEKKKQRMPKRKADAWPASILTDPDVLSLDDEGRFVLCKVCHVHYAVHGGKKPKPVIMNSGFRTRAWEVHKERTNSHRLHKKQDAQLAARANAQQRRADEERKKSGNDKPAESKAVSMTAAAAAAALAPPPLPRPPVAKSHDEPLARGFPPTPSGAPMVPKPLPQGGESQKQQTASPRRRMVRSPLQEPPQRPWAAQADLHEHSRRPMAHERAPQPPPIPPPISGRNTPQPPMSSEQADGLMRWRNMHDDVTRALGSSLSHKRPAPDAYGEEDATPPSMRMGDTEDFSGNNERVAKKLKSLDDEYDAKVMKRQEAYFDRRSDMYKQYWGTLRDVYNSANHVSHGAHGHHQAHAHANESTHARTHNMNVMNRASGGSFRQNQQHHRHQQDTAAAAQAKESIEECTTPDESGSSEPMVKPVVVHDQALINALDRLTGVISKQFSDRYTHETSLLLDAMSKLTNAVDNLRMDHGTAMNHMIQLQEQNLQVMQELLHFKLEKQRSMAAHLVGRSGSGGSGGSARHEGIQG